MRLWQVRRWLHRELRYAYYDYLEPAKVKVEWWLDNKLDAIAHRIISSNFIQKRVTLKVPEGKSFQSREVLELDGRFLKSSGYTWHAAADILADGHLYALFIKMEETKIELGKS